MRPFCRPARPLLTLRSHFSKPNTNSSLALRLSSRPLASQSLRIRPTLYPSTRLLPQRSAVDPIGLFVIALAFGAAAGYVSDSYLAAQSKTLSPKPEPDILAEAVPTTPLDPSIPDMPTATPPGRPGNLSADQEAKLREFWLATLEVFGINHEESNGASGTSTPVTSEDTSAAKKDKKRHGLFGRKHKKEDIDSSAGGDDEDKYGQTKEFKQALQSQSPEALRAAFWSMVKHDNPDALLLRFLRARKWDVHNALVMLISTMHWRSVEMHVDDDIMLTGEPGALMASKSGNGSEKREGGDFLAQLRMGKSFLHGVDKEGRPMCFVRARLHRSGEQTERSLERYTVFTIETARMLLRSPVDTATIVFDMTGFSMANMDYTPVKFMIKCFEANYPESLGSVLIYKAPWIFQGIWKIIRGWLDPVVASKVHFASNVEELSEFIPRNRILKELGGDEDWVYRYAEPSESEAVKQGGEKDALEAKRRDVVSEYEKETLEWAHGRAKGEGRQALADQLRDNYWKLDPYVRARSVYDRIGLIGPGGRLDFYPQPGATAGTSADDDVD